MYKFCLLAVTIYELETVALTKNSANRLRISQGAMRISLRDKVRNKTLRRRTKNADVIKRTAHQKQKWTGHDARDQTSKYSLKKGTMQTWNFETKCKKATTKMLGWHLEAGRRRERTGCRKRNTAWHEKKIKRYTFRNGPQQVEK